MDKRHGKVERFLKLGYSREDIARVLESLHQDAQTNDILEELIKTCHTAASTADSTTTPTGRPAHPSPKLVPRGCGSPQPSVTPEPPGVFRPVVIDGSNVAMSHGNKQVFSCRGLLLAVKWFQDRGIRDITVFVPLWRKEQPRPEAPMTDQHLLHELEKRKILVYTPSRCVNGKRVVCYDDRYVIKLAYESDGIMVSNDNYRDLQIEKPEWKKFIEERLLMYSFANDKFMPPDDPLGRNGPTIDNFLRRKLWTQENKQHCPYGKKCTYGAKCKFYHPERSNQSQLSVADELRAKSKPGIQAERAWPDVTLVQRPGPEALVYPPRPYGHPPTPPPLRRDRHSHRAPSCERYAGHRDETGSPVLRTPGLCPSPEADEAFGSLEASLSLSRLYIQDRPPSPQGPAVSQAYSSGVAGCSQASGDFYTSSTYCSNPPRLGAGDPSTHRGTTQFCCDHSQRCACTYGQGLGSSAHGHRLIEQQHFQSAPPPRQSHSLPEQVAGRVRSGEWGPPNRSNGGKASDSDQRRSVKNQLSNLFPPSIVDDVMNVYPHTLNLSELVPLIQRFRTSHVPY